MPKMIPLGTVLKVLQNLLQENIPIRDMRTIAETLAEHAPMSQDPAMLTAAVRVTLGRSIVQHISGLADEIPVITLDPELEQILQKSMQVAGGEAAGIEPGLIERMHKALEESMQQQELAGQPAVLLVSAPLRPWLAQFIRHTIPGMHVLAYNEIPDNRKIRVVSTIGRETSTA